MSDPKLPIYFAPLQGYTDYLYRNVHHEVFGGINTYYTPFVRIERGEFRKRELRDIAPENDKTGCLIPQLIAAVPDEMRRIVNLFAELGHKEMDINLGCPFPLIARKHKGSGILPYPDEVKTLLNTITEYPHLTFSVKMRLGWDHPLECLELVPLLNDLPLKHITMHPRMGKQQYRGTVDMDSFTRFHRICQHPLLYNGDINTTEEITRIATDFPDLAGIMIGRGLLANPALAYEYNKGTSLPKDEKIKRIKVFHDHMFTAYSELLQQGGQQQILSKMKLFWEYLYPEMNKRDKKKILKSNNIQLYREMVQAWINNERNE
ncbi:MAG: tRNA-dihydrouridine synthase family protein [Bacteroides sp.]|nr:tRNA-dihydrouridine synthase family protein [Bacteroides sp.]